MDLIFGDIEIHLHLAAIAIAILPFLISKLADERDKRQQIRN